MTTWCDRLVIGGILFLICFTPLALGSVHPWAFSLMEVVIFWLVLVWATKLLLAPERLSLPSQPPGVMQRSLLVFLPLLLFTGFILLQLLPLPPTFLRYLSPMTYEVYVKTLPGWPEKPPYEELFHPSVSSADADEWALLPTTSEVQQGAPIPFSVPLTTGPASSIENALSLTRLWQPLSIAPSLTRTDLLKFFAYVSLLLLLRFYPLERTPGGKEEKRFVRALLVTTVNIGLIVAVVGLLQRLLWNGKILWFFTPYDWGTPPAEISTHASGPFVSYTHFANYLTLLFPLTLIGVISPTFLTPNQSRPALRLLCGFTLLLLLVAILLSLSRGGWLGLLLGVSLLFWLLSSATDFSPRLLPASHKSLVTGFALLVIFTLCFVGPLAGRQMDARLEETLQGEASGRMRALVWADTLSMIRDFPVWGSGLGAWPELFPRYQRPLWPAPFFREAHNDYLELLAETGLVGFGLLAWFFLHTGSLLWRGLKNMRRDLVPILAALLTALGIMAFHEIFDFNLQIPANAFLFTLLLGIALRLTARNPHSEPQPPAPPRLGLTANWLTARGRLWSRSYVVAGMIIPAVFLLALTLRQDSLPYPYNIVHPASLSEVRPLLLAYPAHASLHLALARLLPTTFPPRQQALEAALWLEPKNSTARDLYAAGLFRRGQEDEGLRQTALSVFFTPSLDAHVYLNPRLLPWLPLGEQRAIEEGLQKAVAAESAEAVHGLGAFYASLGRFVDEGKLYETAALREQTPDQQLPFLLHAGHAYARAKAAEPAERVWRRALVVAPRDVRAYQYLATMVFASKENLGAAKTVISEGLQNGAEPATLLLALADAAQTAGDHEETRSALQQALTFQPLSVALHERLGLVYLQEHNCDRAALTLRQATNLNPAVARVFYYLGLAEEGCYRFFAAEQAYARAVSLEPDNQDFRQRYEEFRQKMASAKVVGS